MEFYYCCEIYNWRHKVISKEAGTAYYELYRIKDGQKVIVTNAEFRREYLAYTFAKSLKQLGDVIGDAFNGNGQPIAPALPYYEYQLY